MTSEKQKASPKNHLLINPNTKSIQSLKFFISTYESVFALTF